MKNLLMSKGLKKLNSEKKSITLANFIFVFLLISGNVFGQSEQSRWYINLSLGPSFPVGEYADEEIGGALIGGALIGRGFNLSGSYYLKHNLGIGAKLGVSVNPMNNQYSQVKDKEVGEWKNTYALLGPKFVLKSGIFHIDSRLHFGIINTTQPAIKVASLKNSGASASSFGANIGVTGKFYINNIFSLGISVDYYKSKPTINTNYTTTYSGKTSTHEYTQKVDYISTYLAILLKFGSTPSK